MADNKEEISADGHYISYGSIPQFYNYLTAESYDGQPGWGIYTPLRIDGFRGQCQSEGSIGYGVIDNGSLTTYKTHFVIHVGSSEPHEHVYAVADPSNLFFGSISLSHDDGGGIAYFDYKHVSENVRNVVLRKGSSGTLEEAIKNIRKAERYVSGSTLYAGRETDIADWMYKTFVSDMTSREYDVDTDGDGIADDHYTYYTVTSKPAIITARIVPEDQDGCYISNEYVGLSSGMPASTEYHEAGSHYTDYDEGETPDEYSTDIDLRVADIEYAAGYAPEEYAKLYFFNKTSDNEDPHADSLVYRKCSSLRWFDNSAVLFNYIKSKNKTYYDNVDFGYKDEEASEHYDKKFGEDFVFANAEGDFALLFDKELVDSKMAADINRSDDYSQVGYYGFFATVLCFHFKNDTKLVAKIDGIYYSLSEGGSGSLSQFFKYSRGRALDYRTYDSSAGKITWKRFSVPGCSEKVFIQGDTLFRSKKNVLQLSAPSQRYIDGHKDTYKIGSKTNKYDPACSAMSLLTPIEIIEEESKWTTQFGTPDYTFKKKKLGSQSNESNESNADEGASSFDPTDYFVESFGRILVYCDTWSVRKKKSDIKECFDLFTHKKNDDGSTETDVGLFFGPPSKPYEYLP